MTKKYEDLAPFRRKVDEALETVGIVPFGLFAGCVNDGVQVEVIGHSEKLENMRLELFLAEDDSVEVNVTVLNSDVKGFAAEVNVETLAATIQRAVEMHY